MIDPARMFQNMPGDTDPAPRQQDDSGKFYDRQAHGATDTRDPHTAQQDEAAAELYGADGDPLAAIGAATPEHILEARREAGQTLFNDGDNAQTRMAIDRAVDQIAPDTPAVTRQAVTAEWVAIGNDIGLDPAETLEVAKVARAAFADGTPTPDTVADWRRTSANILASYGTRQAEVLAEAQRAIKNDRRIGQMLEHTRLGDHPAVIRAALAAADRRLRSRR